MLKTGDIFVTTGKGIFSRVIRRITGGTGSHVAMVVEIHDKMYLMEMLTKTGLTFSTVNKYGFGKRNKLVEINRPKDLTDDQRQSIRDSALSDLSRGIKYDRSGVLNFVNDEIEDDPNENFCSEWIGEKFQAVGLLQGIDASDLAPSHFQRKNPCLELIKIK